MKGNGNSRYLKTVGEALSLYPTYEDFLQAMIAGTFPVDFNGINKDGWTQLGTLLNKANLLSDTVISTLGLSTGANSTPNDAFNVLANIGNVHVWRKTSVSESPYYELGPIESVDLLGDGHISQWSTVRSSDSVSVANDGKVSLSNPSTGEWIGYAEYGSTPTGNYNFTGKFIQVTGTHESDTTGTSNGSTPVTFLEGVYFIPSDAVISQTKKNSNVFKVQCNKAQKVVGYKAGTHVTYLTSTNRNAYQEGDDAKEAGYVLGDMVSGYLFASAWTGNASNYYYSETIKVSDTGTLTQENVKSYTANATNDSWVSNIQSAIRGKFITVSGEKDNGGSEGTNLVYIPDDAIVSYFENGVSLGYPYNYGFLVNKMQQVTGYPAIPAGTTIEYLGVLGDKIRMQIVSYIGTGTYGKNNPNSITADFKIKYAFLIATYISTNLNFGSSIMVGDVLTTSYKEYAGFHGPSPTNSYGKKSIDEKTFYWYHATNATDQFNYSGGSYWILIIG